MMISDVFLIITIKSSFILGIKNKFKFFSNQKLKELYKGFTLLYIKKK